MIAPSFYHLVVYTLVSVVLIGVLLLAAWGLHGLTLLAHLSGLLAERIESQQGTGPEGLARA